MKPQAESIRPRALARLNGRVQISVGPRLLLACCLGCSMVAKQANAASVSEVFGDDLNTSTTLVHPGLQFSCPWITTGFTAFKTTHPGWNFTYAGAAASSFLLTDLTVDAYYPWVVNQPTYTRTFDNGDGSTTAKTWGGTLNGEAGGAYISLSYTPRRGDPTNIRWIQGVYSSYYGGARDPHLDNPGDRSSPFYDVGRQDVAGRTYFVDIPGAPENEYEGNPVAAVDFQAFVAQDTGRGGGFAHNVTIYGGVWWDYTYTATDVPEPVSLATLGIGFAALLRRRRRAKMQP